MNTTQMKTRKTWIVLLSLLILFTIGFIWGNSMKTRSESQSLSLGVLQFIRPLLDAIFSPENVTDHLVRKLAHFTEFAVLGAELMLLSVLLGRRNLSSILNCMFAGLIVAVTDETIQLFSSRGSQVIDVVLDFSGVVIGVLALLLLRAVLVGFRNTKKAKLDV
jgi:VanZ family protein